MNCGEISQDRQEALGRNVTNLFVKQSIEIFQEYASKGCNIGFSGGKDSQVLYELGKMSGVPYRVKYRLTTVDPPEVVHFIKQYYPEVEIVRPRFTMFQLIAKKGIPPTRKQRFCCERLKELSPRPFKISASGVRAEESKNREKYQIFELKKRRKTVYMLNPILRWGENSIWKFIHGGRLPYCGLYDEGFKRIG